jgi:acyl-CoA hydrolase
LVNLAGKSLRQRAELLTSIAHPDMRSDLQIATRNRFHSIG